LFGDELGLLIFERVKERERQDLESWKIAEECGRVKFER
jgi:hypothetical protein